MSEPAYATQPAAPKRAPETSAWIGFGVVAAVSMLVAFWLAVPAPKVFVVLRGSSLREMITGYWGHVLGYSIMIAWIGGMAIHFWSLKVARHGIGLVQFAGLFVAVLGVTLAASQFLDGALNRFLVERQVEKSVAYYYRALENDVKEYNEQSAKVGMLYTVLAAVDGKAKDFSSVAGQYDRLHAIIAKYRRFEATRRQEARQMAVGAILDSGSRARAGGPVDKAFEDIGPLMDRYWTVQDKVLVEDQAVMNVLARDPSGWSASGREVLFRNGAQQKDFAGHQSKARRLKSELSRIACMMENVRTGGCKMFDGAMVY